MYFSDQLNTLFPVVLLGSSWVTKGNGGGGGVWCDEEKWKWNEITGVFKEEVSAVWAVADEERERREACDMLVSELTSLIDTRHSALI